MRGSMNDLEKMHMPFKLLKKITGDFCHELGRGTFGVVYKGNNNDGQEIAVKLLHSHLDFEGIEFAREFSNLNKLKHHNIVRLVGFCNEEEQVHVEHNGQTIVATKVHRALCFEYLHNGSLQKHLSDEHNGFDWETRYTIIKGICLGLKYLHMELESPVHHLDLKPDNILLDTNMVPKIADFGLSRLIGEENTRKTMTPLGTLGYYPPEFLIDQKFSKEFDIYSLGVMIIKIICGPAAHSPSDGTRPTKFIRQVHKKWRERLRAVQGYTSLEVQVDCQQVKKCIELALRCTDKDKQRRPNIGYIVDQLAEKEKRKMEKAYEMDKGGLLNLSSPVLGELPLDYIKDITCNFSSERELSCSVFGIVYKGFLHDGSVIAVKRLANDAPVAPDKEFRAVVDNLMTLKHENIVELIGFCCEQQNTLAMYNDRHIIAEITVCCLCFKYLPNGTLDSHLYGDTGSINWDTRLQIIKGICQGLHFLHMDLDRPLIHLNLAPSSIWLDDNWVPKIAYSGFSKIFGEGHTGKNTAELNEKKGYMAPEYLYQGEVSTRSDIYCLGLIIMEITTRENCSTAYHNSPGEFVDSVYQHWMTNEQITNNYPFLDPNGIQQVKACIVIGLKCIEINQDKRPSIVDIVDKLNGKRVRIFEQMRPISLSQQNKNPLSTALLDVYPEQLRFPFKPEKLFSCPLQLTNITYDYVAARLVTKNKKRYMAKMPLCAVVPPNSTYILAVTMTEQKDESPLDNDEFLSLESSIVHNKVLDSSAIAFSTFFKEAKEVDELALMVACDLPYEEATSDRPFQYEIEVVSNKKFLQVLSVDVHPTEPWIMTSHQRGDIIIWDYQAQEIETSFDFTQKPVYSAKFIEREEWLVAGDGDGIIYVYSYDTDEEVTSIEAHEGDITYLAVHSTDSLVISSSGDHLIKLWDWEKGWECTQIFEGHSQRVTQVNFNPLDTNSFASASLDHTIKIWNISSFERNITLPDHPDGVLCVHYDTRDEYLITGSWDGTAQIWDLDTKTCIHTLEGHTNRVGCVFGHPKLPVLITGSHDGTVRLWNSDTYRLENIIGVNLGAVYAFGYIERFRRIVVACDQGIAIVEMS